MPSTVKTGAHPGSRATLVTISVPAIAHFDGDMAAVGRLKTPVYAATACGVGHFYRSIGTAAARRTKRRSRLRLGARRFEHLPERHDFVSEELVERFGRAARRIDSLLQQHVLDLGIGEHLVDRSVQGRHDLPRQSS